MLNENDDRELADRYGFSRYDRSNASDKCLEKDINLFDALRRADPYAGEGDIRQNLWVNQDLMIWSLLFNVGSRGSFFDRKAKKVLPLPGADTIPNIIWAYYKGFHIGDGTKVYNQLILKSIFDRPRTMELATKLSIAGIEAKKINDLLDSLPCSVTFRNDPSVFLRELREADEKKWFEFIIEKKVVG